MSSNRSNAVSIESYEQREIRKDRRFARFWDTRMQEPEHPLAELAKEHPDLIEVVRQIAQNAFRSGVFFAEHEATETQHLGNKT